MTLLIVENAFNGNGPPHGFNCRGSRGASKILRNIGVFREQKSAQSFLQEAFLILGLPDPNRAPSKTTEKGALHKAFWAIPPDSG